MSDLPERQQRHQLYNSARSLSLPSVPSTSWSSEKVPSSQPDSKGKRKASNSPTERSPIPVIKRSHSSGSSTISPPSSTNMSSRSSDKKHSSSKHSNSKTSSSKSSSKHSSSSSRTSDRSPDDWSEVAEPDERRRIQNRIAQRKFREKARETREAASLADSNARAASYSYTTPSPSDFTYEDDAETDGLPWGGLNFKRVVERGAERSRYQSSQRGGGGGSGMYYTAPSQYASGGASAYTSGRNNSTAGSGGQPSPGSYSYAGSYTGSGEYEDYADEYDYDAGGYSYGGRGGGQRRGR